MQTVNAIEFRVIVNMQINRMIQIKRIGVTRLLLQLIATMFHALKNLS